MNTLIYKGRSITISAISRGHLVGEFVAVIDGQTFLFAETAREAELLACARIDSEGVAP